MKQLLCTVGGPYKRVERNQVGERKRRRAVVGRVSAVLLLGGIKGRPHLSGQDLSVQLPRRNGLSGELKCKWGSSRLTRVRSWNETRRGCESQPDTTALTTTAAAMP